MANEIRLKRGSGSDPSASDLVTGEVAVRTDTGKLFTKKDDGTVAEISGGGTGTTINNNADNLIITGSGTANTLNAESSLTYDGAGTLALLSTDAGSSAAPIIELYRNSASPADADYLGQIKFTGESDDGSKEVYAKVTGKIDDASSGTEDGIIEFAHRKAGSNVITARFTSTAFKLINGTELEAEGGATVTGNISVSGTVDGRDVAADGTKLDGIEAGATADQTKSDIDALGIAASTATTLATARTIAGVSFDGSANISLNNNAITNGAGYITGSSLNASNLSSGTIPDARFPSTLPAISGANLTNLPSSGLSSDAQRNTVGGTNAGGSFTSGTYPSGGINNTVFGYNAGTNITDGDSNIAIGNGALASQNSGTVTGSSNIAIGFNTNSLTSGYHNIHLGMNAGYFLTTGYYNVALGRDSFKVATTASENTCLGFSAGKQITTAVNNTILGADAANTITTGGNNLVLGHNAQPSSNTVSNEITLGDTSISKFRVPALNFVIKSSTATQGHVLTVDSNGEAGFAAAVGGVDSDSNNNTLGGSNAGDSITTGTDNTFFGKDAGTDITDGQYNTFIGSLAGSNTNSGTYLNTFVGYNAGVNNGNGNHNVFLGANVGLNNEAWDNVFIGNYSGDANTSGTQNLFAGKSSGTANTTGSYNVCLGHEAGKSLTTSSYGVYIGYQAGETYSNENQFGASAICIGAQSGENATGVKNTILGTKAGQSMGSAANCVFIGNETAKNRTGNFNVAIGPSALPVAGAGANTVAVGFYSGGALTSGDDCVFLGHQAGDNGTTGDNNICIGANSDLSAADVSNEITLGNSSVTKFRIPGLSFSISAHAVINGGVFYENAQTVSSDYTVTSGNNAMSAGPITIDNGVTVTVPSDSTLTIV